MEFDKNDIGKNIRFHRRKNNLSLDELASMLGLSSAFIGLIERGQRGAKLDNLIKLSIIFGVDINKLIYGDSNQQQPVPKAKEYDSRQNKLDSLRTLMYNMTEKEIDCVITNVRSIKELRR